VGILGKNWWGFLKIKKSVYSCILLSLTLKSTGVPMKLSKLFSLALLLSGSAYADAPAPEVDAENTPRIDCEYKIDDFANNIPGKVFIHNTKRGIINFDTLVADGFDALICKEEDQTIDAARSANLYVKEEQGYWVVVFNTDKHDDIVDWLNI